jgi:hypothetical protein
MKKIFLTIVYLLFLANNNAQLQLVKTIDFFAEDLNNLIGNSSFDIQNDTIVIYEKKGDNLDLRFYKDDSLFSLQILPLKKYFKKNDIRYAMRCLFQNKILAVNFGKQMLIAKLDSAMNIEKYEIKNLLNSSISFKKSIGSFYSIDYFSTDRTFKQPEVEIYDIKTGELSLHKFDFDFPVATTVSPNNYFEPLYYSKNRYAISDAAHYNIRIYEDNKLIDSIKMENDSLFPKISKKDSVAYRRVQSNFIDLDDITSFNSKIREKCAHIWSIFYLDTTNMVVRLTITENEIFEFYDHLWEKKNNKWELAKVVELFPNFDESTESSKNSSKLWPHFSMYNRLIKNGNNLCFVHYAINGSTTENFQTDTYFKPVYETDPSNLHSRIWYFQKY